MKFPDCFPGGRRSRATNDGPVLGLLASNVQLEMGGALLFGLERRNATLRFIEHCARVSALVGRLADAFSLHESERADLTAAAQLHEIGMISVPRELIETRAPLDDASLNRLRSQASVGAEILRPTHSSRACMLVEHQYTDFDELRLRLRPGSRELLLAGILRVADALDTMLHPRPYQADLDPTLPPQILRWGRGTSFHPQVVESLLQLEETR